MPLLGTKELAGQLPLPKQAARLENRTVCHKLFNKPAFLVLGSPVLRIYFAFGELHRPLDHTFTGHYWCCVIGHLNQTSRCRVLGHQGSSNSRCELRWRKEKKEQQAGILLYKSSVARRSWKMQQKNVDQGRRRS